MSDHENPDEPTEEATASDRDLERLIDSLKAELTREQEQNRITLYGFGGLAVFVAIYLLWMGSQVNRFMQPDELALTMAGAALSAQEDVDGHLRGLLVEGAPDIARMATDRLVDMVPVYREVLEAELMPVMDEVAGILASTAITKLASAEGTSPVGEDLAMNAAATAVMDRMDTMLEEALDEPAELDGPTPRDTIEQALSSLQSVDRGLKKMAAGRGDPDERELVMTWLNVLAQYQEAQAQTEQDAYRARAKADAPKKAAIEDGAVAVEAPGE
jgi:hypothetical protein